MLVFIADDEPTLQILVASIISLVSLQLYVRFSPFMDDDVDSISTIAQLMTFTQLFLALLMSSGVIQDYAPESFCAFALGGMSVVTVCFGLLSRIGPIVYGVWLAIKPIVIELWEPTLEALAGLGLVCLVSKSKNNGEDDDDDEEEEEDAGQNDKASASTRHEKRKHHHRASKVLAKPSTRKKLDEGADDYEKLVDWCHFLAQNNHIDFGLLDKRASMGTHRELDDLVQMLGTGECDPDLAQCGPEHAPMGWGIAVEFDEAAEKTDLETKQTNVVLRF